MRPANLLSSQEKVNNMRIREIVMSEDLRRLAMPDSLSESSHWCQRAVSACKTPSASPWTPKLYHCVDVASDSLFNSVLHTLPL